MLEWRGTAAFAASVSVGRAGGRASGAGCGASGYTGPAGRVAEAVC